MLGLGSNLATGSYIGGFANNYSLEFDATDTSLNCGTLNTYLKNVQKFTISMWVYIDTHTTSGQNGLFGKHRNDYHRTYSFVNLNGIVYFGIANGSDATENGHGKIGSGDALSEDTWYHLVFVYDGTQSDADTNTQNALRNKIYINGANKTLTWSQTIPSSTSNDSTYGSNSFHIGKNEENDNGVHDGEIDEVGIWNEALDADAVSALYNSGKPFDISQDLGNYDNASDLQAWYRMGDGTEKGSGTTIYDMSANSNNASMVNLTASDYNSNVPS